MYSVNLYAEPQKLLTNDTNLSIISLCAVKHSLSYLGGRDNRMAEIRVGKNETLDSALRRFKRSCQKAGVLSEVRKREHYEKPSVRRKKKSEAARKRKYRA